MVNPTHNPNRQAAGRCRVLGADLALAPTAVVNHAGGTSMTWYRHIFATKCHSQRSTRRT